MPIKLFFPYLFVFIKPLKQLAGTLTSAIGGSTTEALLFEPSLHRDHGRNNDSLATCLRKTTGTRVHSRRTLHARSTYLCEASEHRT